MPTTNVKLLKHGINCLRSGWINLPNAVHESAVVYVEEELQPIGLRVKSKLYVLTIHIPVVPKISF